MNLKLLSAALLVGLFGLFAQAANWTYSNGTITDGVWTFNASNNGASLTVNACTGWPTAVTALDFTKEISDGSQTYTIVTLNPQFGGAIDQWGNLPAAKAQSAYVGELKIPTTGLTRIGESAFHNCTNATGTITLGSDLTTIGGAAFCKCNKLTSIEPVVPDSVTSLGKWVFYQVNVPKHIRLENVATVDYAVFKGTGIESVYFGSGLKKIIGTINDGPFKSCANLTNLTFAAGITNAVFEGTHQFSSCPNIISDLDFTGFKKLDSAYCAFEHSTKIKKVKIGPAINQISSKFFNGLTGLSEITFQGKPPSTFSTPIYGSLSGSQLIVTVVPVAYSNEWSVYAADGIINDSSSTFSTTYFSSVVAPYRLLIFPSGGGGGGGELGDGVFDASTGQLTMPGGWKFSADKIGGNLIIGSCVAAPDAVTPLDFSVRITDANGNPLNVMVIDTKFASITYTAPNNNPTFVFTPNLGAHMVGKLTLPTNAINKIAAYAFTDCQNLTGPLEFPSTLLAIEDGAFANCTSLTQIVNYLPDNVTSVKKWAFLNVPANGPLRLASIKAPGELAFMSTGIESVYFGPSFAGFTGYNWNVSPYRDMKALTNVTFDAAVNKVKWQSQHVFMSCGNIEGTLDLSGFSEITVDWGMISTGPKIKEVIFGEGLSNLHGSAFQGMSGLTNVVFKGVPPKTFTGTYLYGLSSTKAITTLVSWAKCKETNASGVSWFDYAVNGVINRKDSTWIDSKVASGIDLKYRPLLAPDRPNGGLVLIVR